MSTIAFRPLLTITVKEAGSGKAIETLSFSPTSDTRRKLADHRLVKRDDRNGFRIYAQYNVEAGNLRLADITERTAFVFACHAQNPARFADLDSSQAPQIYLTNVDDDFTPRPSGRLTRDASAAGADLVRLVPRQARVKVDMTATPKPQSLRVRQLFAPNQIVLDQAIDAAPDGTETAVPVDLSRSPRSAFTVAPQPANAPQRRLFADDALAGAGAFGVLEIVSHPFPGPEPADGRHYSATFRRR